jgi:transcription initiation factor TFIIIB Brf1 subunit/transcription initiation factor TFIIB
MPDLKKKKVLKKCPICKNLLVSERNYGYFCIYYVCTDCNCILDYKYISDAERIRLDQLMFEKRATVILDLIKEGRKKKEKLFIISKYLRKKSTR